MPSGLDLLSWIARATKFLTNQEPIIRGEAPSDVVPPAVALHTLPPTHLIQQFA